MAQSSVVGGTLSAVQPSNGTPPDYYLHNALVGDTGMGGPLFNNCGEVVGVVVPQPKFLARLLISEKESAAYAVPIEWLVSQFATRGVRPARAASPCLSEAEQLAAAEQKTTVTQSKLEEETRRAATTAQAAVDAQTELDAVKRQLDEAQDAGEDERLRLEAEIQARQGKLDEARALETTARDALATAQRAVDEARVREDSLRDALEATQRAAQEREKQYKTWGIAGGAALLLLLLLVWAMKRRAVARERREKTAAKSHAEKAQAGLDAREQEDARIRDTPTVFFDGADFSGQRVALRIPGASIAATSGVVVGRNPADSDFVINHPKVSRKQFRLFAAGNLLMIEDLGSTNGTTVDGKHLGAGQETVLADLSRVELSDLKLSVRLEQG